MQSERLDVSYCSLYCITDLDALNDEETVDDRLRARMVIGKRDVIKICCAVIFRGMCSLEWLTNLNDKGAVEYEVEDIA